MEPKRRLAAIWFADIVGYTTLSGQNEPAALKLVDAIQRLSREIVEGYDGRIAKFIGDAVLAEFGSTESAVRSAVALQEQYAAAARDLGQDSKLRIGVHLGEVTAAPDGDLYGDGVNTAARLHGEAVPGRVIISEDVWRQLRQRPEFRFESLGAVELRGITTRVEIYDVLFGARASEPRPQPAPLPAEASPETYKIAQYVGVGAVAVIVLASAALFMLRPKNRPAPMAQQSPTVQAPAVQQSPAPALPPPAQPRAEPAARRPAPVPDGRPVPVAPGRSGVTPPAGTAPTGLATPQARVQHAAEVRQLLEKLASAIESDQRRDRIAALGPGAAPLAGRGVAQIEEQFGDGLKVRIGRIEPLPPTRPNATEIRFMLLGSSPTRQTMPMGFIAVITRGPDGLRFEELRREMPQRGRGRIGL